VANVRDQTAIFIIQSSSAVFDGSNLSTKSNGLSRTFSSVLFQQNSHHCSGASVFGVRYSYVTKSRVSSSFCATILQTVIAITFRDSDHVTAESRKVKQALPSRSNAAVGVLITSPRWLEQERDSKGRIGGKREVRRD